MHFSCCPPCCHWGTRQMHVRMSLVDLSLTFHISRGFCSLGRTPGFYVCECIMMQLASRSTTIYEGRTVISRCTDLVSRKTVEVRGTLAMSKSSRSSLRISINLRDCISERVSIFSINGKLLISSFINCLFTHEAACGLSFCPLKATGYHVPNVRLFGI
jgi:hypothetical protein